MTPNIDDKFLMSLTSDIKLIQKDIKYIKEKFGTEREHIDVITVAQGETIEDHEDRIRNMEKIMYKGLGAAVVLSMIISAVISLVIKGG